MRGKIFTGVVVLAIIGAVIGINQLEPQRATERQKQQAQVTTQELAEIETLEAESEAEREGEEAPDPLETIISQVQSTRNEDEGVLESAGDFKVRFECSNGDFTVQVRENLAPNGARQFRAALEDGVYDGARFFRVIPGFVAQFGIPGDPELARKWKTKVIKDDPVKASNTRGTITFATSGPNSRTTQLFINFGDNSNLDSMGFAPFGEVTEGMSVVDSIFSGHGEKPDQGAIQRSGNRYLEAAYPELDYIIRATIVEEDATLDGGVDAAGEEATDEVEDAVEEEAESTDEAA